MSSNAKRLVFALLLAVVPCAVADDDERPRFTVDTASESRAGCSLVSLAEDRTLKVEQAQSMLTLPRVIALRQDGVPLPPLLQRDFVLLTNGDRLPLDADAPATLDGDRLRVWTAKSIPSLRGQALPLFMPHVVLVFWTLPESVQDADRFFRSLTAETRTHDIVHLRDGDRIEGTVSELGPKAGCMMSVAGGKNLHVPWSRIAGIAWNTQRPAILRTRFAYTRAVLKGGARVNFSEVRFDDRSRRWIAKAQFGAAIDLAEDSILALDIRQAQAVELSDLTPARYEHRPYLGIAWPLTRDAAVSGHPLRLGGSTYERGLGMHASSEVAYKLDGKFARFDCLVGLDEVHARRGRARLVVQLDDRRIELNEGKEITSRSAPLTLRLDVRNVREMRLIVEPGTFGDVQAHINWAGARLIKKE